jgi:hypothetical protein
MKKECPECGFRLVIIEKNTLLEIKKQISPKFRSLPDDWSKLKQDCHQICPSCDAYALGIDMAEGFPFQDEDGQIKTVHELYLLTRNIEI